MRISATTNYCESFGKIAEEQKYGDLIIRDIIRENLEKKALGCYKYVEQFGHKTPSEILQEMDRIASNNQFLVHTRHNRSKSNVDEKALEPLKLFIRRKRANELYSGGKLTSAKNGIETAKKAGIKSIVFFAKDYNGEYEKRVKDADLKFIDLSKIGSGKLSINSISLESQSDGTLVRKLIRHPELWITHDENGKRRPNAEEDVCDLQLLIAILNGENANFPTPIYYGCDFGTDRTFCWSCIYGILANEDKSKPLSDQAITKLKKYQREESRN